MKIGQIIETSTHDGEIHCNFLSFDLEQFKKEAIDEIEHIYTKNSDCDICLNGKDLEIEKLKDIIKLIKNLKNEDNLIIYLSDFDEQEERVYINW